MEPVLVTGGAGFIGSHLTSVLSKKSRNVRVLDKRKPRSILPFYRIDLTKTSSFPRGIMECKQIVHLAAEVSILASVRNPQSSFDVNAGGTLKMLEHARRTDVDCFLYASTAAVYGDKTRLSREEDLPMPKSPYAASKLAGEYYCRVYAELYDVRTVILRLFNVFGPGQVGAYAGVISEMVGRVLRHKPPLIHGNGKQIRDFVYVRDVAELMAGLLESRPIGGSVFNVGTGKGTSVKALADTILKLLKADGLRPVYDAARPGDIRYSLADVSRVRKLTRFRPEYTLEQGLAETIDWFSHERR